MREAQEWAETHNDELHDVLNDLGASLMVHELVDVRVPHRHSVVQELHKWQNEDSTMDEGIRVARRRGGGFFQKVWNGDVLEAFKHADSNNQRIIAKAYSKDYLLGLCSHEMECNIVHERWP